MVDTTGFRLNEIILPGDRIRAFDFPFSDSYIEGKVVSVERYFFETMIDYVSNDDIRRIGTLILVPISCADDKKWRGNRIEKLDY